MKQGETRGDDFILCTQYVIIKSLSVFYTKRLFDFRTAFKTCCILRAMTSGAGAPYFKWDFIYQNTVLQGMGSQMRVKGSSGRGNRHTQNQRHECHRSFAGTGRKTHAAQGKRLCQQSRTSNHRKQETVEPRQSMWLGGASKHSSAGQHHPPQRGGAANLHIHVAAVTPRTALPRESQKGKSFKTLTRSQIELPTGAMAKRC